MITKFIPGEPMYTMQVEPGLIEKMGIAVDTPVELSVVDGILMATPLIDEDESTRREMIARASKKMHKKFANVFRELAK